MQLFLSVPWCPWVRVRVRTCTKTTLTENMGHLGEGKKIDRNVSTVSQDASHPPNNGLLRRGRVKKRNVSILLMGKASVGECLRNGRAIREVKQRQKNSGEKKETCFLCLRFLRQHTKPLSRDFSVISSVRWLVPGEVITLNRFTSDTDPGSYRCLHSC